VTDPRAAEQISGLVVLPVILLMLSQSFGLILINQQVILIMGAVVVLLDAVVVYFAIQLFQRETILTRWK
jgi:ABC-2 type transport system permease protein